MENVATGGHGAGGMVEKLFALFADVVCAGSADEKTRVPRIARVVRRMIEWCR
jgi:hypothetical protein